MTTNLGFWPGKVAISVPNTSYGSVYLQLSNTTAAQRAPPPNSYTKEFAVNVSSSLNTSVYLTLGYNCTVDHADVAPFVLNGAKWSLITPFTTNPSLCVVSFLVPNDPVVALMLQNQIKSTTTTTIAGRSAGGANGKLDAYEVAAAVVGVVVFLVLLVVYMEREEGSPSPAIPDPQSPSLPEQPQQ